MSESTPINNAFLLHIYFSCLISFVVSWQMPKIAFLEFIWLSSSNIFPWVFFCLLSIFLSLARKKNNVFIQPCFLVIERLTKILTTPFFLLPSMIVLKSKTKVSWFSNKTFLSLSFVKTRVFRPMFLQIFKTQSLKVVFLRLFYCPGTLWKCTNTKILFSCQNYSDKVKPGTVW